MADRRIVWSVIAALAFTSGCRATRQVRDPEYAAVVNTVYQPTCRPESTSAAVDPVVAELEGPQPLDRYIQVALAQNPEIQAARKRMEAFAHQVPVAASLPDPMLNTTAFPEPVQTAAGQQELILGVNQKFPWRQKLSLHASVAESQTNVARAQFATVELATIEKVKKAYYELYFIQQATRVTEAERDLLVQIRDAANARYRAALTSQQDVLRAELELSQIENDLIRLRQQLDRRRRNSPVNCTWRRKRNFGPLTVCRPRACPGTLNGSNARRLPPDPNCTLSSRPCNATAKVHSLPGSTMCLTSRLA